MTKRYKLKNDRAGFRGDGIDLCGDALDSVFPRACTHERLTIVASTRRQHRKGEVKVHISWKIGSVPMVEIDERRIQILSATYLTLRRDFQGAEETLYIRMIFS